MKKKAKLDYNKELQNEAFWKGLRVIQSCRNLYHIEGARKYTDKYIELFCYKKNGTLTASETVSHQYETLQLALKEQIKKLN